MQQAVDGLTESALPALESQFAVNLFSFAGDLVELPSLEQVPPPGPVTHIGEALLNVLRGAQSGAIAAVVLVSDGADNSADFDQAKIAEIASFGVPVHTVGVGAETMPNDLELEDVQLPSVGLAGSTVSAQVSIRHSGAALAQLKVYDGDAILASEAIQLPGTTGVTTRWVDIDVGAAGVRDLKFALDALPDETNVINNSRLRPMEVPEQRRHILYIEGEPRWEYKFIRRAIDENPAVRVASLLKTTPNKFYRQGVESPDELVDGFPTEELALFRYDALMIGSFEAAALTPAQHDMIREFVSRRGGSLLMLGGRRGITDGGWGADERRGGLARAAARARRAELRARAGQGRPRAGRAHVRDDAPRGERRSQRSVLGRVARSRRLPDARRAQARRRDAARGRVRRPHRAAARAPALRLRQRVRARDGRHLALANAAAARGPTPRDVLAPILASRRDDGAAARDLDVGARVLRRREHCPAACRGSRQVVSARERRRRHARGQRRHGSADDASR